MNLEFIRSGIGKFLPSARSWNAVILIGLAAFLAFFVVSLTRIGTFTQDETEYHYPNLVNFHQNGLAAAFNDKYSAANTPLPYVIVAGFSQFFGPDLLLARVVTFTVSFVAFLAAASLLKKYQAPQATALIILFYPYFFLHSFVFYAVNFGLMFLLLGLWVLERGPARWRRDLLAGTLLSGAVLCQQFYIVVPIAVLCYRVLQLPPPRRTGLYGAFPSGQPWRPMLHSACH